IRSRTMAQNNTHRAFGRAVTPVGTTGRALRNTGGAAVLGTVVIGSALLAGPAQAAPSVSPAAPTISAQTAAPATPAPAHAGSAGGTEQLRGRAPGAPVAQPPTAPHAHGGSLAGAGKLGRVTQGAVKDFQRSPDLELRRALEVLHCAMG